MFSKIRHDRFCHTISNHMFHYPFTGIRLKVLLYVRMQMDTSWFSIQHFKDFWCKSVKREPMKGFKLNLVVILDSESDWRTANLTVMLYWIIYVGKYFIYFEDLAFKAINRLPAWAVYLLHIMCGEIWSAAQWIKPLFMSYSSNRL